MSGIASKTFTPGILIVVLLLVFPALSSSAAEVILIPGGFNAGGSTNWRYRLGTNEASTPIASWRTHTFVEDASWTTGALPLGYALTVNDPSGYEAAFLTTLPSGAIGNYRSVFLRKTFVITNRAAFSTLTLGVMVDDGLVGWLNGREIMRNQCCVGGADANVPTFDAAATVLTESTPFTNTLVNDLSGPLLDGTNVLCIQLFNADLSSADLVIDAMLSATIDDVPPTIVDRFPPAGSTVPQLNSVQVVFSEAVNGVDATDLLINGLAAIDVIAASPTTYTWIFSQPATGIVTVAFAPAHGITDLAQPSNAFTNDNWTYTLNTNLLSQQLFISEFMAANSGKGTNALRDEDGDASDWIEIYNGNNTPADIGGWFLTDTANNPARWRFPNGAIVPARGYLVLFASGKNRTNVLGRLHTNFQLNSAGEYLALVDSQTNVVFQFYSAFPPQQTDISYGRDRFDVNVLGYYPVPTPGMHNTTIGPGFGPAVQFSRAGGTFTGPFDLVLSISGLNSEIRYTIVSTNQNFNSATNIPTSTSTLYTGPIRITNTVQVRARAFPVKTVYFPGPPTTESYVQLGAGTMDFISTLPIVVIHTLSPTVIAGGFPGPDNSVIIECFDNDGGTSSLNKPPQLVSRAGINYRGSSTQGYPKGNLSVELWDEFNNDQEKSFLGLPKESDWILSAPHQFDLSLMHNPILHQFVREMGYYSSRTRFVEVFFHNGSGALVANTNVTGAAMGNYHGVYVLEEKVKRDVSRVNIDKLQPEHTNYPAITGGYLLKIDRADGNERTFNPNGANTTVIYQEPDGLEMVTPARAAQAAYILAYFNNMNSGLLGNALTNIASTNHYSNYLNVDATLDHHVVAVLVNHVDGYRLGDSITKPRNGKLIFGPLWDADRGLGSSRGDARSFNPRTWQSWDPLGAADHGTDFFQGTTPPGWMGRWFADVDFWQRWIDRYQYWRASVLDSNRVASMIDRFGQELREAQVRDLKRWGGSGASDITPRSGTVTAGGGVYINTFPGTFQGEIDFQKRWLIDRLHFMDTNLLSRPAFNHPEGQVSLNTLITLADTSAKAGTAIYYTLDGTDPRGFQGTTNPAAIRYAAPITITNNVRIRARAVNPSHRNMTGLANGGSHNPAVSTPWSGDIASTYFITPPPLVITELMYHPESSQTDIYEADDFEYIELKNIGSNALNLVGFKFTNGVDFTFTATNSLAPGGYVLIVGNINAFVSRYGAQTNIAGAYGGNLDNRGERITLVGPRLEPILDFVYSDAWLPLSDGFGFSMAILDPNAPLSTWNLRSSWRLSLENGSPGVAEPPPPNFPVVVINEALTHSDLPQLDTIELFNPSTNAVNIGGWFITDDPGQPSKYQIPANTIIPAGGFALFDETQFNTGLNAFALGEAGDEVYLFSALGGMLSGYTHGFSFGAAQSGVSFGRYVNSQGDEYFVAQGALTLGASNSAPLVGPVVISEIMYHPPDVLSGGNVVDNSIDEFIELYNLSATNVPLYHVLYPSNTWRLSQAVTFDFPSNISIAPASFVLLVNFNPATNSAQLAAFRAEYGVLPSISVFGPYSGKLDNSAQSIRLLRPDYQNDDDDDDDDVGNGGNVPYILVDQTDYQDGGVWPKAADGTGASLQRLVLTSYGNDPTNWTVAKPSAGGHFLGGTPPVVTQHPSHATVFLGGTTNFTAAVSGAGVAVQWRFNGVAIPDATNTTLTLSVVQYLQAGLYDLVAFNSGGVVISSNANLTVFTPVAFSIQPANQNVLPGTNVTLVSEAFGTGPIRYQWRYEGTNIPNATNSTYSFTGASLTNHGIYQVTASDGYSFTGSSDAFIFVLIRPGFVQQPLAQTILQGQNATFSVVVTGAPPIWYRWIRGGTPYVTSSVPILVLTNVQASVSIRVAITNMANGPGGLSSSTVQLTVLPDFDGDGIADYWETNYPGFSTNNAADAPLDFDGDGMINRDEFVAGTNPTNALSVLKLVLSATNSAALEFVAQTNISYTVQYRTNLTSATWSNVTSITATTMVRTVQVNVPKPPPEPARFYRIVTPLVP